MSIPWGFTGGVLGGLVMALVSDIAYRLRLFGSSMIVVDGSFTLRMMGKERGQQPIPLLYPLGTIVHLATSGVFGAAYAVLTNLFQLDPRFLPLFCAYVVLLWLAMLFSALPIAGLGLLGRRAGRRTWLEQLFLHALFGLVFWQVL